MNSTAADHFRHHSYDNSCLTLHYISDNDLKQQIIELHISIAIVIQKKYRVYGIVSKKYNLHFHKRVLTLTITLNYHLY